MSQNYVDASRTPPCTWWTGRVTACRVIDLANSPNSCVANSEDELDQSDSDRAKSLLQVGIRVLRLGIRATAHLGCEP
jgi:hypothetical protein